MITYFTFAGQMSLYAWMFGLPLLAFFASFIVPAWFATDGIADTAPDGVDWSIGIILVVVDILAGIVMLAGRTGAGATLGKSLVVLLIAGTGVVIGGYKYLPLHVQVNMPDLNFNGVDDRQRFHASSLKANPPPLLGDAELELAYYVPDKARFEAAVDRFLQLSEQMRDERKRVARAWNEGQPTTYNYPGIFRGTAEQEAERKQTLDYLATGHENPRRGLLAFAEENIHPVLFAQVKEPLVEGSDSLSVRVMDNKIVLEGLEGKRGGFLLKIRGDISMQPGSHPRADEGYFYIRDQQLDWIVYGDITDADRASGRKILHLADYPDGHAAGEKFLSRKYKSDSEGFYLLAKFVARYH